MFKLPVLFSAVGELGSTDMRSWLGTQYVPHVDGGDFDIWERNEILKKDMAFGWCGVVETVAALLIYCGGGGPCVEVVVYD